MLFRGIRFLSWGYEGNAAEWRSGTASGLWKRIVFEEKASMLLGGRDSDNMYIFMLSVSREEAPS
jgi:hypothetical protein